MNLKGLTLANRYVIEREIGRGGMATVWLADDPQHGRKVAIKTLHHDLAGAIGTDRFLREIRLTAELQHPNIVPILDSGVLSADGLTIPWYAMPLLEGESLRQRLNREAPLPIDEALRIVTAAGKALEAAHQRSIVHRDIKPENVFLSGEHVYVVDFGVAKAIAATDAERLTSTGLAIGTPAYMSPEQALAGPVDARTDQYSLSVVLYEMLAGEPPFAGPNQQAVIARRLTERARPILTVRAAVPPALERAVLRALERTPADRFSSIGAFLAALQSGVAATPDGRPLKRLAAIAGSLGLLAIAAWGARAMMTRRHGPDPEVVALYQRGVQAYDRRTAAGVAEAVKIFNDAIGRDSSYVPAWNALAKAYVRAYQRGFPLPETSKERYLQLAVTAVNRSLNLDSTNADTWTTRGMVAQQVDPTDIDTPLASLRRSLRLDSTQATAWHFYALMTAESGDVPSAIRAWHRSVRLDPRYGQGIAFLAHGYYWRGMYDSAAVWADSAVRVDPTYLLGHMISAWVETERGHFTKAEDQAQAALKLADEVEVANLNAYLATLKARAGNLALARANVLVAQVIGGNYRPTPPHTALALAEAQAAIGNLDGAMEALGMYATPRDRHFQLHLRCGPAFAPLDRDPRFHAMLVFPRPVPGSHC